MNRSPIQRVLGGLIPLMLVFSLSACAAEGEVDVTIGDGGDGGSVDASGFLQGMLDGFISPFTGIASLFDNSVEVFEDGNGNDYTFGFVLGLLLIVSLLVSLLGGGRRYYSRR
ncbi:MAG: hypothetical protein WEE36_02840 [Acidimicrobiia bacterium]